MRERIRFWRPAAADGVELYSARLLAHRYGRHFHEEYTIGLNDGGLGSFWCRGEEHRAAPGSLNLIEPGEVHTGAASSSRGWAYRNLYVRRDRMEEVARHLGWPAGDLPRFRQSIAADAEVRDAVDLAFETLRAPHGRLETDTILLAALSLVFDRFADRRPHPVRGKPTHARVAQARECLESRDGDDISLDRLAAECGLSPFYLIRSFRQAYGLPPHAYQIQVRLQRAKADLKSDASLSEIALNHGFFDQSHFHRHFKRAFGVAPGRYRQGNRVQDDFTASA